MTCLRAFLVSVFALCSAPVLAQGECGYDFCWGAVGIGPGGTWSWWAGAISEYDAVAGLQSDCPNCDNIHTFYNTCGSIAVSNSGAWGFGWGETQVMAEGNAVQSCRQYSGGDFCVPQVWACSY